MSKTEDNHTETDAEQLSEEDIKRIAQEETAVQSSDGKTYRLADLVDLGLEKQQAIGALGLIALGSGVGAAVTAVSSTSARAQASTGSGTLSIGEILSNSITTGELQTGVLSGALVDRSSPIDNLAGNIYVQDTEPSDPTDNDLWIDTSGGS